MVGHCEAGAVKRAFGWAAGLPLSGSQGSPRQSIRPSGGVLVRPSHQMSPSFGLRHVGKDAVAADGGHRAGVGLFVGSRGDPEEPGLGVDRAQAPVRARLDPGDVVAHRGDLPAFLAERFRRHQHRQVGLAAGAGEGGGDIGAGPVRRFRTEDQHVFGQPALVTGHGRRDAQRETLLAQQGVAAIAAAVGDDALLLRVVDDVLGLGVAGPGHVLLALFQRRADAVQALHERSVAEHVEHGATHARHDAHVHHHVGGIGEFDADLGDRGAQRTHAEWDHVHRTAAHAAREQTLQGLLHLARLDPVVGWAGVLLVHAADVGAVLDAGDVAGIAARCEAARPLLGIQRSEGSGLQVLPSAGRTLPGNRRTIGRHRVRRGWRFHPPRRGARGSGSGVGSCFTS
jgi:hypothetical protein